MVRFIMSSGYSMDIPKDSRVDSPLDSHMDCTRTVRAQFGAQQNEPPKQEETDMDNKKETFCKMYAAGFSAEAAVWEAGYLRNEAKDIAEQLLSSAEMQAAIEQERAEAKKNLEETERMVQALLTEGKMSP